MNACFNSKGCFFAWNFAAVLSLSKMCRCLNVYAVCCRVKEAFTKLMCLLTVGPATLILQTGNSCYKGNDIHKGAFWQTEAILIRGVSFNGVTCKIKAAGSLKVTDPVTCPPVRNMLVTALSPLLASELRASLPCATLAANVSSTS